MHESNCIWVISNIDSVLIADIVYWLIDIDIVYWSLEKHTVVRIVKGLNNSEVFLAVVTIL